MANISAVALFCDDIREEKSGTHTIVGVWGDNIAVAGFPGQMAKLGIYVRIHIPTEFEPKEFEIYFHFPNGDRILINTITHDIVKKAIEDAKGANNKIAGIYSQLIASPFPVAQPGRIKVELKWADETMLIGGLNFVQSDPATTLPNASEQPA